MRCYNYGKINRYSFENFIQFPFPFPCRLSIYSISLKKIVGETRDGRLDTFHDKKKLKLQNYKSEFDTNWLCTFCSSYISLQSLYYMPNTKYTYTPAYDFINGNPKRSISRDYLSTLPFDFYYITTIQCIWWYFTYFHFSVSPFHSFQIY